MAILSERWCEHDLRNAVYSISQSMPQGSNRFYRRLAILVRNTEVEPFSGIGVPREIVDVICKGGVANSELTIRVRSSDIVSQAFETCKSEFGQSASKAVSSELDLIAWISSNRIIEDLLSSRLHSVPGLQDPRMDHASRAVDPRDVGRHELIAHVCEEVSKACGAGESHDKFFIRIGAEECHLGIWIRIGVALDHRARRRNLARCFRVGCTVAAIVYQRVVEGLGD